MRFNQFSNAKHAQGSANLSKDNIKSPLYADFYSDILLYCAKYASLFTKPYDIDTVSIEYAKGILDSGKGIIKKKENNNNKEKEKEKGFLAFWELYPNKKAKKTAREKWDKINIDLYGDVMKGLNNAIKSKKWTDDNGEFIPHPATWIHGKRWDDEYAEKKSADGVSDFSKPGRYDYLADNPFEEEDT